MKIKVTQVHIDLGKKENCILCPIALAFLDLGYKEIHVYREFVLADELAFDLPDNARVFIDDFDCDRHVEPFEFKIEATRTEYPLNPLEGIV